MPASNPWKISGKDRAEFLAILARMAEEVRTRPNVLHPVGVAWDRMVLACHESGEAEIGMMMISIRIAMQNGGERARDQLCKAVSLIAIDYHDAPKPDPRRN